MYGVQQAFVRELQGGVRLFGVPTESQSGVPMWSVRAVNLARTQVRGKWTAGLRRVRDSGVVPDLCRVSAAVHGDRCDPARAA